VLSPAKSSPWPAPAAPRRPVPAPRSSIPPSGAPYHEASTGVQAIHPSGLPLACGPRMERGPLGFPPSFAPRRLITGNARRGGDRPSSTDLEQRSRHQPNPQSTCSPMMRATSRRTTRSGRLLARDWLHTAAASAAEQGRCRDRPCTPGAVGVGRKRCASVQREQSRHEPGESHGWPSRRFGAGTARGPFRGPN
jgi:hypothetical protein